MVQVNIADEFFKAASFIGVLMTDKNGVIIYVDDGFEVDYGLEVGSLLGQSVYELEEKKYFNPSTAAMVLKTKKEITTIQELKNGRKVIVSAFPLYEEGEIVQVITFTRDIDRYNKIKKLYEELSQKIAQYDMLVNQLSYDTEILGNYATNCEPFRHTLKSLCSIAHYNINILILGETGVGKTLLAKKIHELSEQKNGPFVEVNCGAFPESLVESELPIRSQTKLLKVLQDGEFRRIGGSRNIKTNCRIISATNKDLLEEVERGSFRRDLYYRLNTFVFTVPPLRDRKEDIGLLSSELLKKANLKYHHNKTMDDSVIRAFLKYDWPGNIRELENTICRMLITSADNLITASDIPTELTGALEGEVVERQLPVFHITDLSKALEQYEGEIIKRAYAENRTSCRVASALNISQATAARKIRKYIKKEVF